MTVVRASHAKEPGSPNRSVSSAPHPGPLFLPALPHSLWAGLLLPFPTGLQKGCRDAPCLPPPSKTGTGEPGPGIRGRWRRVLWGAAPPASTTPEGTCEGPVGQAECHWLSFAFALKASRPPCGSSSRLRLLRFLPCALRRMGNVPAVLPWPHAAFWHLPGCKHPARLWSWHCLAQWPCRIPLPAPSTFPTVAAAFCKAVTAPWAQEAEIHGNMNLIWLPGSSPHLQLAVGACAGSHPSPAKVTH